jgi:NADPH:quinone reductase-like Zn-dependent oxidoreductase
MSVPKVMKAFVLEGNSGVVKKDVPVPEMKANQVLVRINSVAINPTDWKHAKYQLGPEGSILGCDYAGEIVQVGADVKDVKVGDQCFGCISGASTETPENGAFAEYAVTYPDFVFKVGNTLSNTSQAELASDTVKTLEGAASLPVALLTVMINLGYSDGLKLEPNEANKNKIYLVWGGASSVGAIAIQFAKYLGFRVIATCSPHNAQFVESLGAEKAFNYRDSDVVDQIKAYAGDKIEIGFDTISSHQTMPLVNAVLPTDRPVHMDATLGYEDKLKDQKKENVKYGVLFAYHVSDAIKKFGVNGKAIPAPPGLQDLSKELVKTVNKSILPRIRHLPCKILPNGLDSVKEGLEIVETGKNSGTKIVIKNI